MEAWALQFPHGSCKQGLKWITHPSSGQAPRSPLPDLGAGLGTSGGRMSTQLKGCGAAEPFNPVYRQSA